MHYIVQARFKTETAAEFLRKLTDGTIENQKPDGEEIVESMQRAVVDDAEVVRWTETCYCSTPLLHERETVYDHHFAELKTEEIEEAATEVATGLDELQGRPFMEFLQQMAEA